MSKMEKAVVMDIPLKGIKETDDWNRPMESADSEMEVLEASMARLGQLEDIIVRPLGAGRFGVISGHRRVAVARKLRWPSVRARVVEVPDDDSAQAWGFATNHARKPIGIFWEAMECRRLADKGMSPADIGVALGHGENWVKRRLRLDLAACKRFKAILDDAGIPVEGVHASNWEILGECDFKVWEYLERIFKEHEPAALARCVAKQGWLAGELWSAWTPVQGKPWSGVQRFEKSVICACEDCPHYGGTLAVLFPELEGVNSSAGKCSQRECVERKRLAARQAAKKEIHKTGWKGKVLNGDSLTKRELDDLKKCKSPVSAEVAVVFGGDKSGTWGFYRKIKELPKEAEPGGNADREAREAEWRKRDAANAAFIHHVEHILKAELPRSVDGVELPDRVFEALEALQADLRVMSKFGDFDLWTYCEDAPKRRAFNALARLVLFDVVADELMETIKDLERKANLEEVEDEDEEEDAKPSADETQDGDATGDGGERCKHCGEDGYCENDAEHGGGGYVCCHCADFEPAEDGE